MVILDAPGDSSRISVEEGLKGAVWLEGEASGTKLRLNVYLGWLFERGGWDGDRGHSRTFLCSGPSYILAALNHTCKSRWLCESAQLYPSFPLSPSCSASSLDSLCRTLPH